jgi:hypothetical protein
MESYSQNKNLMKLLLIPGDQMNSEQTVNSTIEVHFVFASILNAKKMEFLLKVEILTTNLLTVVVSIMEKDVNGNKEWIKLRILSMTIV